MDKNTPELRFKGFSDEWEEKKLVDLGENIKGKGYTKKSILKEENKDGVEFIPYGSIFTDYKPIIDSSDKKVIEKPRSIKSKTGDLIMPASSTTSDDSIVVASAVSKEGIIYGGDINIFRVGNVNTARFLAYSITHGPIKKDIYSRVEGTTVFHLYFDRIDDLGIYVPSEEEQTKIGNFFKNIDDLIELEENKLNILNEQKRTLLNKMFPAKGETKPEIRFKGFDDEWIKLKYKDIFNDFSYGISASSKDYDGKNKYLRITDIDEVTRKFSYSKITSPNIDALDNKNDKYILKDGDICFARTGSVGRTYKYDKKDGKVYYAGYLIKGDLKTNIINKNFFFYNTLTENYFKQIRVGSKGSVLDGINAKQLKDFILAIPTLEEQTKIGNFFKNLDEQLENQ